MLILRGSPALSPFRLQKLLADLVAAGLPARAVGAEFVHLADLASDLGAAETTVLAQLLTYGPRRAAAPVTGLVQIVAPRPGTLSPWSSKATDISHICGLASVKRIERLVAYTVDLGETVVPFPLTKLSAAQSQTLRAKLRRIEVRGARAGVKRVKGASAHIAMGGSVRTPSASARASASR